MGGKQMEEIDGGEGKGDNIHNGGKDRWGSVHPYGVSSSPIIVKAVDACSCTQKIIA